MKPVKIVTGKTRLLGVIGNPIEHSISPELHNTLSLYLSDDFIYVPFKVDEDNLENALLGLKALGFIGFNVTIPYKEKIIKYLDRKSHEAQLIGAVNTVAIDGGKMTGFNTDAEGFARSFKHETRTDFKDKRMLILGAGGAARAISIKAALEGAEKVYIINRTPQKPQNIANIINNNIRNIAEWYDYNSIERLITESDIIINTTPVGMYPNIEASPVSDLVMYKFLNPDQIICDIIYNPIKTRFLLNAEKAGCKTLNGLGMLFYQGIYAYEIWSGRVIEQEVLDKLYGVFLKILK